MTLYYGLDTGLDEYQAASSGSATTSKHVEIVVDESKVVSRDQLIQALQNLENYILRQTYPL